MFRNKPSTTPPSERTAAKRSVVIAAVALAVAVPAGILAAGCANGCEDEGTSKPSVPFCSLPERIRASTVAGFRAERSPDVFAVARGEVSGGTAFGTRAFEPPWPSVAGDERGLPLLFWGHGIEPGSVPDGATLDAVAPTLAEVMRLDRKHSEVRSGRALEGIVRDGLPPPRLVVLVAWKPAQDEGEPGSFDSRARTGAGTREAASGSLPLDPAALMATIGSGGLPRQHGITGALIRNEDGEVVEAWGPDAPISVIASLGDDLDEANGQEPLVGVVGTSGIDRGLIGGNWYLDSDKDDVVILQPGAPAERQERAVVGLLDSDYGRDAMTDLLALAFEGSATELDRTLEEIERRAITATGGSVTFALVGLPAAASAARDGVMAVTEAASKGTARAEMVDAVGVGGVFLDQQVLAGSKLTDDVLIDALSGSEPFADAFPTTAITFARYC